MSAQESKTAGVTTGVMPGSSSTNTGNTRNTEPTSKAEAESESIRMRTTGASVKGGLSATRFANSFVPASARKKFRDDPEAVLRGDREHERFENEVRAFYSDAEVSARSRLRHLLIKPYVFVFFVVVFIISMPFLLR